MIDLEKTIIWQADQIQKMDKELQDAQETIELLNQVNADQDKRLTELLKEDQERKDIAALRDKLWGGERNG